MKKKLSIAGVIIIVLAIAGYYGFQWYLDANKAKSEVIKIEAKEVETKEETTKGVVLNSMADLDGTYVSETNKQISSEIIFKIGGTAPTQGTFKKMNITFEQVDSIKSITVKIDPSSIYTAEDMRDDHLKGEDFFNVEKFPEITFHSNEIVTGDTSYIAKGSINFMGLSNKLDVPFNYIGQSSEDVNVEIFEGQFMIDRVKYGMEGTSGADNNVTISFYCALRKK